MMTLDSIELKDRYIRSIDEYFNQVNDDRLLAMIVNPLLATKGFQEVIALSDEGVGDQLLERAKKLLLEQTKKFASAKEHSHQESTASEYMYYFGFVMFLSSSDNRSHSPISRR